MADKDKQLLTATVTAIAATSAYTHAATALNGAHYFLDTVTHEETESKLSEIDAEGAVLVHDLIVTTGNVIEEIARGLEEALKEIGQMDDDALAAAAGVVEAKTQVEIAGYEAADEDDDEEVDMPGQYL